MGRGGGGVTEIWDCENVCGSAGGIGSQYLLKTQNNRTPSDIFEPMDFLFMLSVKTPELQTDNLKNPFSRHKSKHSKLNEHVHEHDLFDPGVGVGVGRRRRETSGGH